MSKQSPFGASGARAVDAYRRVRSSGFIRSAGTLAAGSAVGQLAFVAVIPLLARLYDPGQFGQFTIFLAVAAICSVVVTLRYETAIALPKSELTAAHIVAVATYALGFGTLVAAVVALAIVPLFTSPASSIRGWLVALAIVSGGANAAIATATNWYNRNGWFRKSAYVRLAQGILIAILPLLLYKLTSAPGLVIGYALGQLLIAGYTLQSTASLLRSNPGEVWRTAAEYRGIPKYQLPTNLLDVAGAQLPVLLLSLWFGQEIVGQFGMAWKSMSAPVALIGGAIGQVFLIRAAGAWPDARRTQVLLLRTWALLAVTAGLPVLMVLVAGGRIFATALGADWQMAGEMAAVLAPLLYVTFIASPTSTIYLVLGLHRLMPWFGVAVVVYRPLSIFVAARLGDVMIGLWMWVVLEVGLILTYHWISLRVLTAGGGASLPSNEFIEQKLHASTKAL